MIEMKYLIMIGVIVCLLVLYYFYDEISNIKKSYLPTYQKTMALEAKMMELDKRTMDMMTKKCISRTDSPPMSITYYSDMVKNGNLSVKYADLSESEADKLLRKINSKENNKQNIIGERKLSSKQNTINDRSNIRTTNIEPQYTHQECLEKIPEIRKTNSHTNDSFSNRSNNRYGGGVHNNSSFSDNSPDDTNNKRIISNTNHSIFTEQDKYLGNHKLEINNKLKALRDKSNTNNSHEEHKINPNSIIQYDGLSDIIITSDNEQKNNDETDSFDINIGHLVGGKNNFNECHEIFDGLEKELMEYHNLEHQSKNDKTVLNNPKYQDSLEHSGCADSDLDSDVIKSISESIQYADMSSINSISDIPIVPPKKKISQTKKNKQKSHIN